MKTICFLLGEVECRNYHFLGFDKYLKITENTTFQGSLFKLHITGNPLKDADSARELVSEVLGWNDALEISEEEHDLISNAIK